MSTANREKGKKKFPSGKTHGIHIKNVEKTKKNYTGMGKDDTGLSGVY